MAKIPHRYLGRKTKIRGHVRRISAGLSIMLVAVAFALCVEIYTILTYYSPGIQTSDVATVSMDRIDPRYEGKLVYLSGKVKGQGTLKDALFGVEESALLLERHVRMYQWYEDKAAKAYHQAWLESLQTSAEFEVAEGHANPSKMPYMTKRFLTKKAMLGAFEIAPNDILPVIKPVAYPLSDEQHALMHPMLQGYFSIQDGSYYFGQNPASPKVGDTRISYTIIRSLPFSMVGRQQGNTVIPHISSLTGQPMVEVGVVPLDEFMENPSSATPVVQAITWSLRVIGFVIMFYSIRHITIPLRRLSYLSPSMERMFSRGNILIASMGSILLFGFVMAVCWGVHYPLLGGVGLVAFFLILLYILKRPKRI